MKRIIMALAAMLLAAGTFAQVTDSSNSPVADTTVRESPDTLRVGNFIIVRQSRSKGANGTYSSGGGHRKIILTSPHAYDYDDNYSGHDILTTNWLVFDLGFSNIDDKTNYEEANKSDYLHKSSNEDPFTKSTLKLRTKSSNVNIWLFMQRLNITKHVLNLKYGLGYEMFNFFYDQNISYNKTPTYVFRDSVEFSKDKLFAGYATIPMMINVNPWPNKKLFNVSLGACVGYLIGSRTKQVSDTRGKQKTHDDFDLNRWRFAYVAELSMGPVRLYGSYSINPLHEHDLKQYPYAIGLRISCF